TIISSFYFVLFNVEYFVIIIIYGEVINLFSERIKSLRKRRRLTQEDVANGLEIARTTYSGYERGTSEPDFTTLNKIADFFEVDVNLLLAGTSKELQTEVEKMIDDFVSLNEDQQKYISELISIF